MIILIFLARIVGVMLILTTQDACANSEKAMSAESSVAHGSAKLWIAPYGRPLEQAPARILAAER